NKGHIKALRNWLGEEFAHIPIHSVVVFLPRTKFKSHAHFTQAYVVYPKQLKQVLGQHETKSIGKQNNV
ncbi:nuclease-related domain-containing protein, partial [Parageobacillus thermoglucosidasius]